MNVHMVVRLGHAWHSYRTEDGRAEDVSHGIVAIGPTYGQTDTEDECCEYGYQRTLGARDVQFLRRSIARHLRQSGPQRGAEDIRGD
jgi:hypothetical protein